MKIKAAPGMTIRDPKTKKVIPEDGIEVREPLPTFWVKRLAVGDAVKVTEESPKPSAKKKEGA